MLKKLLRQPFITPGFTYQSILNPFYVYHLIRLDLQFNYTQISTVIGRIIFCLLFVPFRIIVILSHITIGAAVQRVRNKLVFSKIDRLVNQHAIGVSLYKKIAGNQLLIISNAKVGIRSLPISSYDLDINDKAAVIAALEDATTKSRESYKLSEAERIAKFSTDTPIEFKLSGLTSWKKIGKEYSLTHLQYNPTSHSYQLVTMIPHKGGGFVGASNKDHEKFSNIVIGKPDEKIDCDKLYETYEQRAIEYEDTLTEIK